MDEARSRIVCEGQGMGVTPAVAAMSLAAKARRLLAPRFQTSSAEPWFLGFPNEILSELPSTCLSA